MALESAILLALLNAELDAIKGRRDAERVARDILSNYLDPELQALFPGVSTEFLDSNGHFANEMARGVGELADAVAAAALNWTGPAQDAGVDKVVTPELVRLLVTDALVSGKLCLFPRLDEAGRFTLEAPSGYLHPVFDTNNVLNVLEVLQVVFDPGLRRYVVTRFSNGLVERYPPVEDWLKFADRTPLAGNTWVQSHAPDRLPLSFVVVRRNARREPEGLVVEAVPAFRRYAKTAVNRNAVQEAAGFPERVVKSDRYLRLFFGEGTGLQAGLEHPALTAFKQVGPRQIKFIGTNDVYEVTEGVDPAPHLQAEATDKQALLDILRSPDLSGGVSTGVGLAERQSKTRALVVELCNAIANTITDAMALASQLRGSNVPEGISVSLTPRFATDVATRVTQVKDLYAAGGLNMVQLLTELQTAGFSSISDKDIDRAQQMLDGTYVPASLQGDGPDPVADA